MIWGMGHSKMDRAALSRLEDQLGSSSAVDAWLRELGLRVFLAAQPPRAFERSVELGDADPPADSHPHAAVVRDVLRRHGMRTSAVRRGRPATALVTAFEGELEVSGSEEYSQDPLVFGSSADRVIAVSVAGSRTSGSAGFTIAPPSRSKKVWAAMLFVLLDERRAWLITRDELDAFHRTLRHGGEVSLVSYDKERKLLRVRFPRTVTGYDLRERLV